MDFDDYEVGFNIPAKTGMKINEIQTPCLVIDYNKFENNIHNGGCVIMRVV